MAGTSFESSLYLLWALLKGRGLLDPGFYNQSALARRIGVKLTFDVDDSTGVTTTLVQTKFRILDRPALFGPAAATGRVREALQNATDAYGRLTSTIVSELNRAVGARRGQSAVEFTNLLNEPESRAEILEEAGDAGRRAIDRAIEQHLSQFVALTETMADIIADSRSRPELAVGVTYRNAPGVASQTRVVGILDLLARRSLDFTVNAGFEHVRPDGPGDERVRFELATQVVVLLSPDNRLQGKAPTSLAVSGSGRFAHEEAGLWRAQARLLLPLAEGFNIPISATWASRRELIEESRVIGQVGFSLDTSQILAALP